MNSSVVSSRLGNIETADPQEGLLNRLNLFNRLFCTLTGSLAYFTLRVIYIIPIITIALSTANITTNSYNECNVNFIENSTSDVSYWKVRSKIIFTASFNFLYYIV